MHKNLIPLPYRHVSVQYPTEDVRLDEPSIRTYLVGKEAYRRTDYVVLRGSSGEAVVRVEKAAPSPRSTDTEAPLFAPITGVEVLALPDTCTWVECPDLDVGNPSAMAAKARALGLGTQATLIVEGLYGHVNFLHHPDPAVVRVVEVVPPEPPKLVSMVHTVLSYADLPPIVVVPTFVDVTAMAREHAAEAYLFPCRASGLEGPGPTYYLDERPRQQEWLLVGCERSRQIHRHFYGDEPRRVEMCPRRLTEPGDVPTLLKCCLLETEIEIVDERTVVVPWGAELRHVERALRALVSTSS